MPSRTNATIAAPPEGTAVAARPAGTAQCPKLGFRFGTVQAKRQRRVARRNRRFRSLRLSVRTPPFHGGESGSIPLGSATPIKFSNNFKSLESGLANSTDRLANADMATCASRFWFAALV